ncbi:hypothetical protein ILYODFUR_005160, partial [Ilyodon furcidens]
MRPMKSSNRITSNRAVELPPGPHRPELQSSPGGHDDPCPPTTIGMQPSELELGAYLENTWYRQ